MSCSKIEPLKRINVSDLDNGKEDIYNCIILKFEEYQSSAIIKLIKSEKTYTVYKIQAVDKIRSPQQNNLFHGPILDAIVNWTGDTDKDYFKAYLKHKFLTEVGEDGKKRTKHTSELTIQEFNLFLTKCVTWIIDNGGGQYLPSDIMLM